MWNMPLHAEHHLFPSVPFHRLPALHAQIGDRLAHVAPGYAATNRAIVRVVARAGKAIRGPAAGRGL